LGETVRSLLAISLMALAAAGAWAQQPSAPAKPANPNVTPTTLRLPELDKGETVTITGMVPIPKVGDGAPLFTSLDLKTLGDDTQKAMTDIRHDFRRCGGSGTGAIMVGNPSWSVTSAPVSVCREFP